MRLVCIARSGIPKHQSKRPKVAGDSPPEAHRQPRTLHHDNPDVDQRCPVWRFEELDPEWPPAAAKLNVAQFHELLRKLGWYESQRLCELWSNGSNNHVYAVEDVPESAKQRLVELSRDDLTALHSLRLGGKYRVIGVLREHIFYVHWIDPEHEFWPSVKKYT